MEPTNAGRVGPAAPIAAAGAAAASADHPARRAPDGEVFTTPGSSPRHAFVRTPWHPPQAPLGLGRRPPKCLARAKPTGRRFPLTARLISGCPAAVWCREGRRPQNYDY